MDLLLIMVSLYIDLMPFNDIITDLWNPNGIYYIYLMSNGFHRIRYIQIIRYF